VRGEGVMNVEERFARQKRRIVTLMGIWREERKR
jgi:hypothetical protein